MFFQPVNPPPELVVNAESLDSEDRESGGKAVSSAAKPDENEAAGVEDSEDVGVGTESGVGVGDGAEL
eukprot:3562482-Ditylum_brightwellii.AAC.1